MDVNSIQSGINLALNESKVDVVAKKDAESQLSDSNLNTSTENRLIADEAVKVQAETADKETKQANDVESAVNEVSSFLQEKNRALSFSVDEQSDTPIIQVKDVESGDVIRQIPTEEVLKLAERINKLQDDVGEAIGSGVLINKQI